MRLSYGVILLVIFLFIVGCSSGKKSPVEPADYDAGSDFQSIFYGENIADLSPDELGWQIAYAGQFVPNDSGGLDLVEDREILANYNITSFVMGAGAFSYEILNIHQNLVEVDVTIENPTPLIVYDVRLIFNNMGPNKITNPDAYTMLFSSVISPYIAFAKDDPFRMFPIGPVGASETEKIFIELNGGPIGFVITATMPLPCEEPFELTNLKLIGQLNDEDGGWADISCRVDDHQWDLEFVAADLRPFTGNFEYMVSNPEQPQNWEVYFTNELLAVGGKSYPTWLGVKSVGSPLLCYNLINIPVEGGLDPPIVTITTPSEDPWETPDRFTTIAGTIENFEGEEAIMEVNGDEQIIQVVDNTFSEIAVLIVGENLIKVSAEGPGGIGTDSVTINCTATSANLWVRLTWDQWNTDVDLYITEPPPSNYTCWYGGKVSPYTGAQLDVDNVEGYGPEHYYLSVDEGHTLIHGTYELDVHYYSDHMTGKTVVSTVLVYKADEYYGEWSHIMSHSSPMEAGPDNRRQGLSSWWDYVADINL